MSAGAETLAAALRATTERGRAYGDPTVFFKRVARRWSHALGIEISDRQVVLLLLDLKVEREHAGPHPDGWTDICGYGANGAEIDHAAAGPPKR